MENLPTPIIKGRNIVGLWCVCLCVCVCVCVPGDIIDGGGDDDEKEEGSSRDQAGVRGSGEGAGGGESFHLVKYLFLDQSERLRRRWSGGKPKDWTEKAGGSGSGGEG